MFETPKDMHQKNFATLLYDAVYLLYFGADLNIDDFKDDVIHTCVRSSIVNSMLTFECAANCLIHSLG